MREYWLVHRFLPRDWNTRTGAQARLDIRQKLHAFHDAVNARLGKPVHSLDAPHQDALAIALSEYEWIRTEWGKLPMSPAYRDWRHTASLLLQLVQAGPN
jgi:hypothetical protein